MPNTQPNTRAFEITYIDKKQPKHKRKPLTRVFRAEHETQALVAFVNWARAESAKGKIHPHWQSCAEVLPEVPVHLLAQLNTWPARHNYNSHNSHRIAA